MKSGQTLIAPPAGMQREGLWRYLTAVKYR
jgi:hypothetical protein